jgi:CheY-like chemotaxis protein
MSTKKKVLLVDSRESMFHGKLDLLDREILDILSVDTGDEAMALHRKEKADVIIVGHDLPDMPPLDFCKKIRADEGLKDVSIIAGLKNPLEMAVKRFREAGANVCVRTPVDTEEFVAVLAKLLSIPFRQAIRVMVKVRVEAKGGSDFMIASTVNLSATGMLIECESDLEWGDGVEASFYLPAESGFNKITALAMVVRSEKGRYDGIRGYGLEFTEFVEGDPFMVDKYVQGRKS